MKPGRREIRCEQLLGCRVVENFFTLFFAPHNICARFLRMCCCCCCQREGFTPADWTRLQFDLHKGGWKEKAKKCENHQIQCYITENPNKNLACTCWAYISLCIVLYLCMSHSRWTVHFNISIEQPILSVWEKKVKSTPSGWQPNGLIRIVSTLSTMTTAALVNWQESPAEASSELEFMFSTEWSRWTPSTSGESCSDWHPQRLLFSSQVSKHSHFLFQGKEPACSSVFLVLPKNPMSDWKPHSLEFGKLHWRDFCFRIQAVWLLCSIYLISHCLTSVLLCYLVLWKNKRLCTIMICTRWQIISHDLCDDLGIWIRSWRHVHTPVERPCWWFGDQKGVKICYFEVVAPNACECLCLDLFPSLLNDCKPQWDGAR